jgi:hypothetical protein
MSAVAGGVITPKNKAKRVAKWIPQKGEYIVNCHEARRWKCGKCWKHRLGFCPMGAKCTLSHETDEALQERNERNKLGGYLEGTKVDGYVWFAKEVKKGSMTFPAGTFNADAPELQEALDYFSKREEWDDVERIQSFISANKTAPEEELTEEEVAFIEECYQEVLDGETASIDDVEVDEEELAEEFENFQKQEEIDTVWCLWSFEVIAWMNDRDIMQQNEAQLQMLRAEEQRLMEVCAQEVPKAARSFAAVCRAPVDDMDDYEWEGMAEEARTSSLM